MLNGAIKDPKLKAVKQDRLVYAFCEIDKRTKTKLGDASSASYLQFKFRSIGKQLCAILGVVIGRDSHSFACF